MNKNTMLIIGGVVLVGGAVAIYFVLKGKKEEEEKGDGSSASSTADSADSDTGGGTTYVSEQPPGTPKTAEYCGKCKPIRYDYWLSNIIKCCTPRLNQTIMELKAEIKSKLDDIRRKTGAIATWTGPYKGTGTKGAIRIYLKHLYDEGIFSGCADPGKTTCVEWK